MKNKYYSSYANNITPYTPGEQPQAGTEYIKINTNESPYPPSPKVYEAIHNFDASSLRLYPSYGAEALKKAIADRYGLEEKNIFVGNGSDEVLALCFRAFFDESKKVFFPAVTYSFYPVYCSLFNISHEKVAMKDRFYIDMEALKSAKGGIVIANPNAPTSIALSKADIAELLDHHRDDVVIIDEAYVDFGGESCVSLVPKYENLIVVQTMSKSRSLAGLRVGYAMANEALINGISRIKDSFNSYPLDSVAQTAALAAVCDEAYYSDMTAKIIATRDRIAAELKKMGYTVVDSKTNFLYVSPQDKDAKKIYQYLKNQGILVRFFESNSDYLRITVGTDEDMDKMIKVLKEE